MFHFGWNVRSWNSQAGASPRAIANNARSHSCTCTPAADFSQQSQQSTLDITPRPIALARTKKLLRILTPALVNNARSTDCLLRHRIGALNLQQCQDMLGWLLIATFSHRRKKLVHTPPLYPLLPHLLHDLFGNLVKYLWRYNNGDGYEPFVVFVLV